MQDDDGNGDEIIEDDSKSTRDEDKKSHHSQTEMIDKLCLGRIAHDDSITINNGQFTIEDITCICGKQGFSSFASHQQIFLIMLRSCVGFKDNRWLLKMIVSNKGGKQKVIREFTKDALRRELENYRPFACNRALNLASIILNQSNRFQYADAKLLKPGTEPEGVINLFAGYGFEEIPYEGEDEDVNGVVNHITQIICNGDEAKAELYMRLRANFYQNITVKNGPIAVVTGSQRSGKSIIAELFRDGLGVYAQANVDDWDKIGGKFNGGLERLLFVNMNEPPDCSEKTRMGVFNRIKARNQSSGEGS